MREASNVYNILLRERKGKRHPEIKIRCKWEDDIKMILHRVGGCGTIGLCGSGGGTVRVIAPYEQGNESSSAVK